MKASGQKQNSQETIIKGTCTRIVGDTGRNFRPNIEAVSIEDRVQLKTSQKGTHVNVQPSIKVAIRGKVVDEEGNSVPFASVVIKGTKCGVKADQNGTFSIGNEPSRSVSLVVSCVGFGSSEIKLDKVDCATHVVVLLKQNTTLGLVIVASPTERKTQASLSAVTTSRSYAGTSKNNSFSNFKIYPNPLPSNSSLHIEWKQKEFGDHVLELFNQSGQRVFSQEIYIDQEAKLLEVTLPPLSAGNYFLRLTGKSTGRSHSQKLVVN